MQQKSKNDIKMFFNIRSYNKTDKFFTVLIGVVVISTFLYIDKTRKIPQYGIIFYEMGLRCNDACGQDKQLQYFQKAVRYNPKINDARYSLKLSDAHYRSALIYEEMGDSAQSVASLIKAIELYQWNTLAYYRLGVYNFKKGSYESARRYFLQSYKIGGYPNEMHYYLARIYDKQKKTDLAIGFYNSMVLEDHDYASEIYPRLAELYYSRNYEAPFFSWTTRMRESNLNDLADQLEQHFEAVKSSELSGKAIEVK